MNPFASFSRFGLIGLSISGLLSLPCFAQGAVVPPISQEVSGSVVESLRTSGGHQALSAAIEAAELTQLAGPVTFFAPTDRAFENMPAERRKMLLLPENKDRLRKVLSYHIVPGSFTAADLAAAVQERHGRTTLRTVSGDSLRVGIMGDTLVITDHEGGQARVGKQDIVFSDGTIHVIDAVLIPRDVDRGFTPYR